MSPVLRKMLSNQICKPDTSVDPMTVVAKGAAIYASTIKRKSETIETNPTKIQLEINFEPTSVFDEEDGVIKILQDKTEIGSGHASILRGLANVLAYRNVWILLITPIGVSGALLTFGGLWGVPYLRQVYGLDASTAAAITSASLVAWALGGPFLGALSERLGRRKPLHVLGCIVGLACWTLLAFVHLPLPVLIGVLLVAGFFAGNLIIGFAFNKESVPPHLAGTASGVCNMGPLMGGMLLQPIFGWVLDLNWQGVVEGGVRLYPAEAFQAGFLVIAAFIALSMVLSLFSHETHCRQNVG